MLAWSFTPWVGAYLPRSSSITARLTLASTSGVAPFGVVVDGVQTTSTDPTIRPLRDLAYYFECDDLGMGVYDHGMLAGTPRNRFLGGPVAAFTLVTPGTRNIRMWVSDGVSVAGPVTLSVTVQDPDVVFAGSLTTVVSASGDFTNKPVGALEVTSSDFDAQITSVVVSGSGKRVLFREGETFTSSAPGNFNSRTNYHVGVFGPTASYVNGTTFAVVEQVPESVVGMFGGNAANAAQNNDYICAWGLHFTRPAGLNYAGTFSRTGTLVTVIMAGHGLTTGQTVFLDFPSTNPADGNYVVTVLDANTFTVTTVTSGAASGNVVRNGGVALTTNNKPDTVGGVNYTKGNFTYHRCKASRVSALGSLTGGYNSVMSQCVGDNTNEGVAVAGGIGIFMDETVRGAVSDSDIDCNHGGEHCIRRQGGDYCTFTSNRMRRPATAKSFFTLRGWAGRTALTQVTSRYNQASYNDTDGSNSTVTGIFLNLDVAPQSLSAFEPIADTIIEGNLVRPPNIGFQFCSRVQAVGVTYRNNAHHFSTQTTQAFYGVQISGASTNTAQASDCEFINNSFSSVSVGGFSAFSNSSTAPNRVYNNLAYAPSATKDGTNSGSGPTFIINQNAAVVANNSSNAQIKSTNPLFSGVTTTLAGFVLQAASPYKGFGADYKVRIDARGKLRATPTAGASNSDDEQVDGWTLIP